ncbi:MAG: hypothetical protein J7M08_04145 [Planctomycetes bacterium]|nr:hypothetical protein [Planctomycetota bacterium]
MSAGVGKVEVRGAGDGPEDGTVVYEVRGEKGSAHASIVSSKPGITSV